MRINKFIASRLGLSRRKVDQIIQNEAVFVNDKRVQVGQKVEVGDRVVYKNYSWIVKSGSALSSILVYKPIMSLVTRVSQDAKKTIYDVLPPFISDFKPAGRLDYMSEGLLVMSQDGDLIYSLTHPSQNCTKLYLVGTNRPLEKKHITKAKKGMTITINDEPRSLAPVLIEPARTSSWDFLNLHAKHNWYVFHLQEGRNNQIRRMCASFGVKVPRLIRIQHGDYKLTRELKEQKIISIES